MPIRWLVLEDEFFTRDVLSLTLRRANIDIEVDLVDSGEAALTYLKNNIPDVAILDLHMPRINGYDVINAIRADDALKNIFIIVLTANPSAINSPEARKADAFLTKPIDIKQIIELIRQQVRIRQA